MNTHWLSRALSAWNTLLCESSSYTASAVASTSAAHVGFVILTQGYLNDVEMLLEMEVPGRTNVGASCRYRQNHRTGKQGYHVCRAAPIAPSRKMPFAMLFMSSVLPRLSSVLEPKYLPHYAACVCLAIRSVHLWSRTGVNETVDLTTVSLAVNVLPSQSS